MEKKCHSGVKLMMLLTLRISNKQLLAQFMFTTNLTTSTRTIEDMWNPEMITNLLDCTFQLNNWWTVTQLLRLEIFGKTKRQTIKGWHSRVMIFQLFHAVLSLKVTLMILLSFGKLILEKRLLRFQLKKTVSPGSLILITSLKTLIKNFQPAKHGKTYNGLTWKMMSTLSFGWEQQVYQISENFGEELRMDLRQVAINLKLITNIK